MWDICEDFCLSFNENEFCFMIDVCRFHLHLQLYTSFCNFNSNLPLSSIFVCLYLCICTNFCIFIYFRLLPNICVLDHTRFIHSFLPHHTNKPIYIDACICIYKQVLTCIFHWEHVFGIFVMCICCYGFTSFSYCHLAYKPNFWFSLVD